MALWHHPDWPAYKDALARLADASAQVEAARDIGGQQLVDAGREFAEAVAAYDFLHARVNGPDKRD